MSKLENRVKPIVLGLIEGKLQSITSDAQSVLSIWAVKNAMVYENFYQERPRFYIDGKRHQLRIANVIPPRTSVWIAKCVNHPGAYTIAEDLRGPLSNGSGECNTYATTMVFASLALQVVSSRLSAVVPLETNVTTVLNKGQWDDIVVRIWPTTTEQQNWPSTVGLNGLLGLDEFGERFLVGNDNQDS